VDCEQEEKTMNESVASATALVVSLMRALHTRADPQPILDDPWGDILVPGSVIEAIQQRIDSTAPENSRVSEKEPSGQRVDSWLRTSPAFANVILRSRYTEDALQAAIERGVKQYVLIGAGFDSYALRIPAEAGQIDIYEIDHPATQSLKKQRLAECDVPVKDSVHFLAADLARERLSEVLSRSLFKPTEPAFFSWLGVTMYLTREANMLSLRDIALCGAPGSELVFTYIDQELFTTSTTPESGAFEEIQKSVASMGEPFLSGFDPTAIEQDLRGIGLELEENLDDRQLLERYDRPGVNGLQAGARSRTARATIVKGIAMAPEPATAQTA
jgi:methyltransferase (TIGR00027 family)